MKCPVCEDVSLSISSRDGVEIDFCPQCRGVWLDRGELDKIIDRAGGPQPATHAPAPQQYAQPSYPQGQQPYRKKRENWLSELFD